VSPAHQRQGIGAALIKQFLQDLDEEECWVISSAEGKGLYEKLGWKLVCENKVDLKDFGWGEKPFVSYSLRREGKKSEV